VKSGAAFGAALSGGWPGNLNIRQCPGNFTSQAFEDGLPSDRLRSNAGESPPVIVTPDSPGTRSVHTPVRIPRFLRVHSVQYHDRVLIRRISGHARRNLNLEENCGGLF
jgi:hypothetical protein